MPDPQNGGPAQTSPPAGQRLSRQDAEQIALKNNPAISVARLSALASQQVTREVRSSLWPAVYANLTAVDAHDDSRIAAGGLNNPIIFERAAAGTTVSQLITDFGHTTNLVASARLQARAEDQNAIATKEQVLLAVDQAFYNALQSQAVLRVAEQTVNSRQTRDRPGVSPGKKQTEVRVGSQLRQRQSFPGDAAQVGRGKQRAGCAGQSLGRARLSQSADHHPGRRNRASLPLPTTVPTISSSEAFSRRPELLALGFESESEQKLRNAERDQNLPTISALGAIGDTPIRDSRLSSWYGAVGVNVQVPIFNGFLFTARTHEADLRAQAAEQRVLDLRNRISRDVRSAWLNARTAYQRLSVSSQLLDQANRALDLSQTRYRLGLGSIVELSQAQLQQTQAQIGNAQAGYEYRLAQSVLRYQTGSL